MSQQTYQPRRAYRSSEGSWVGGVAGGVADHLGVDPLPVRIAFVAGCLLAGIGLMVYGALWLVLPADPHFTAAAPGVESATRTGKRRGRELRWADAGPLVAVGAVLIGLIALFGGLFGSSAIIYPGLLVLAGIALVWWQADQAQRDRWWDSQGRVTPLRAIFGHGGIGSYARVIGGLLLLVLGVTSFAAVSGGLRGAAAVGLVMLFAVVGLAVVLGPLVVRLAGDLSEERAERVRTQERADVAAHLHDSVLQTLALIQKSAGDRATVARLARAQERDLRSWLYDDAPAGSSSAAAALKEVAAQVEDATGVPVEVVCVGDHDRIDPALVAATREAIVNAAKHSGAPRVDVYAELGAAEHEVFVRDRGAGFDPDRIAADRHGVRDSIVDRMQRHGGVARVITGPGQGTEIRLRMPTKEER